VTLIGVLLLASAIASPWGAIGHRLVGRIAEPHLSPEARQPLQALLGPESLAQVSTWPDEIRADPAWKRANPWHYVNIADDETYETAPKHPGGDVVEALQRLTTVLQEPQATLQDQVVAVKCLVHLVGDIHQPLHVGRREDQGGNTITVFWFGAPSNLHKVWDEQLIEAEQLRFSALAAFLTPPTAADVAAWQHSTVLDWVREAMRRRSQVDEIGDGQLGYAYLSKQMPTVKERLRRAEVRLAGLLNTIFALRSCTAARASVCMKSRYASRSCVVPLLLFGRWHRMDCIIKWPGIADVKHTRPFPTA
jgi:hypothetical protein